MGKALSQPKHAAKYVWIIRKEERTNYKGLKNVYSMKGFVRRSITSVDDDNTLTGMGGR